MNNKKIIAKGLIVSILLFNAPTDAMADIIENYKLTVIDEKENKFEEFFNNLFDRFKKPKELENVNTNIRAGTVKNITLSEGQFVPNLDYNPDGFEKIVVTTTGNKKLEKQDYDNLRTSGIPKVDLSNSKSDEIPAGAFTYATHLSEFKFPQGVKIIGGGYQSGAFEACVNLTGDLVIPDGVTTIGRYAFYNCSGFDGTLTIPESVNSIVYGAFSGCRNLKGSLKIPSGVTAIEGYAFRGCSGFIGDLVIPDSVTTIGSGAFEGCTGFTGRLTIPKGVAVIENYAFKGCNGLTGDLVIPDTVTSIGNEAFYECSGFNGILKISKSVTSIGNSAFTNCSSLNGELIIPEGVTTIGSSAFEGCLGFRGDLIIPNSVVEIGELAFNDLNNINRIFVKVNSDDSSTNYRYNTINTLPDNEKTILDLPYNFDTSGKWFENKNITLVKPIIKSVVDGYETEIIENSGEVVSLYISVPYNEDDVNILKDRQSYKLPSKNEYGKHIFVDVGYYEITVTTKLGNISNITFNVKNNIFDEAESAVEQAESSKLPEDIEKAQDLVNSLPESMKKDEFIDRLEALLPSDEIVSENQSSNFDIYINSENILSLSLETSFISFEDFSGIEDVEKLNAISFTVSSSLPYDIKAYLPNEITGVKTESIMDKEILNIRKSDTIDYKTFIAINTPIVLSEDELAGHDQKHSLDIKLKGSIPFEKDSYKATVKLEIQQK